MSRTNGLIANDVDVNGDALTAMLVDPPVQGTVSLAADGSFVYTPVANDSGTVTFSYRLSDGEELSNVAIVTIELRAVNDAPVAAGDAYYGLADQTLQVSAAHGLLANDADVEGDPLTVQLVDRPAQGTLNLAADGSFSYVPPAGFTGSVSFTYRASDGRSVSPVATARIAINSLQQQRQIVINELHVNPDIETELVEFVELHNRGNAAVDLSGWTLRNAVSYTFPAGTMLNAGAYVVVTQNPQMFATKFGKSALGPWTGWLRNENDTVELWTATGDAIDEVDYQLGFPWPTVGDAPGPSIQLINPLLENDLGGSWKSAVPTPGARTRCTPSMRRRRCDVWSTARSNPRRDKMSPCRCW